MVKKQKNKKGNVVHWLKEHFFISGSGIFCHDIGKIAKAFAEHLILSQIMKLIRKRIKALTQEDKNIVQSVGLLLNSIMEECGTDMEEARKLQGLEQKGCRRFCRKQTRMAPHALERDLPASPKNF